MNEQMDIRGFLRVVFRRQVALWMTVVVVMGTVVVGQQFQTPVYEGQVTMLISAKKQIESPYYRDIADSRMPTLMNTQSEIVKSSPVLERVVRTLRLSERPLDYEKEFASDWKAYWIAFQTRLKERKLARMPSSLKNSFLFQEAVAHLKKRTRVMAIPDTDLFTISVKDFGPKAAAMTANVVSRSYSIFDLEQQLAEILLKYGDKHQVVVQLKDHIASMKESMAQEEAFSNIEALGPASVKIVEQADVPLEPLPSHRTLILLLSFFLSVALGMSLIFVWDSLDTTVRSGEALQGIAGVPVLESVPRFRFLGLSALTAAARLGLVVFATGWFLEVTCLAMGLWQTKADDPAKGCCYGMLPFLRPSGFMRFVGLSKLKAPWGDVILLVLWTAVLAGLLWAYRNLAHRKASAAVRASLSEGAFGHAVRNLCEQIHLNLKRGGRKTLMWTSCLGAEGTTTLAVHCARYLSETAGLRVLLVDANLDRPALNKIFGLSRDPGLSQVLLGRLDIEKSARAVTKRLSVVTAGTPSLNPAALLDSEALKKFLPWARERYDLVLFDSFSLRASEGSRILASEVESVVLVVSEGKVRQDVLRGAAAVLRGQRSTWIGTVLNNRSYTLPQAIYNRI